jgi:hypothetical protein
MGTSETEYTPLSAVLPRLYWMVFGNIILLLTAVTTMLRAFQDLHLASLVFWANAACMVIIRYLDVRYLRGETADSQAATIAHWKRYSIFLLVGAASTWALTITIRVLWI